jgi:hypothetical protein
MVIILLLACGFVSPGANYTKTEQTQSTIMKKQSIITLKKKTEHSYKIRSTIMGKQWHNTSPDIEIGF